MKNKMLTLGACAGIGVSSSCATLKGVALDGANVIKGVGQVTEGAATGTQRAINEVIAPTATTMGTYVSPNGDCIAPDGTPSTTPHYIEGSHLKR